MSNDTQVSPSPAAQTQRKRWLAIVVGVFAAICIACGAYWAIALRYVQTTDDAYVNGNVVQITPQLSANDIFYASSSLPSQRILARLFRRHGATGRNAFRIGRYVGHPS